MQDSNSDDDYYTDRTELNRMFPDTRLGPIHGQAYIVHTQVGTWFGVVTRFDSDFLILDNCFLIPNCVSMGECTRKKQIVEAEYAGEGVILSRSGSVLIPWRHAAPMQTSE